MDCVNCDNQVILLIVRPNTLFQANCENFAGYSVFAGRGPANSKWLDGKGPSPIHSTQTGLASKLIGEPTENRTYRSHEAAITDRSAGNDVDAGAEVADYNAAQQSVKIRITAPKHHEGPKPIQARKPARQ